MDSFFARNRLSAYLDRTLPKAEAIAVAEAVARDIALSADLRAMRHALTLLSDIGRTPAPTGFLARTMATVAQQPVPGSQVAWLQRRLARVPTELLAVFGAALVVVIALGQVDDGPGAPPPVIHVSQPAPQPSAAPTPVEPQAAETPATASSPPEASVRPPASPTQSSTPAYDPSTPLAYRILHGGDQVLYDIATLADQTGGRLVDVHGKLVTPHSLNEARSFSQIYLVTPLSQAEAAHNVLMDRSGMAPYNLDGLKPPLAADEAVFLIEAQL
jgi:hypothetical protein